MTSITDADKHTPDDFVYKIMTSKHECLTCDPTACNQFIKWHKHICWCQPRRIQGFKTYCSTLSVTSTIYCSVLEHKIYEAETLSVTWIDTTSARSQYAYQEIKVAFSSDSWVTISGIPTITQLNSFSSLCAIREHYCKIRVKKQRHKWGIVEIGPVLPSSCNK